MKSILLLCVILGFSLHNGFAQDVMTPELLWKLGRVGAVGITKDGKNLVYSVSTPDIENQKNTKAYFTVPVNGGTLTKIESIDGLVADVSISPDGKFQLTNKAVKLMKVAGSDFYPELDKSNVKIYNSLDHRHWDTWRDGTYNHVFVHKIVDGKADEGTDIMKGEKFDTPTMPFGDESDYTWSTDSKYVVYVSKKLSGTEYVQSTNTDLYQYDIASGKTVNLTEGMLGYDTAPAFSSKGDLAWLSMARNGYESDKNDIYVMMNGSKMNLTKDWDGTVNAFMWSKDAKKIYFVAPTKGTIQLFEVDVPGKSKKMPKVVQLTEGDFDVNGIVAELKNALIVTRNDMNHAKEIFKYDLKKKSFTQLSNANNDVYANLKTSKVEKRWVKTTDGKQMLVWVIFPPDFDASKKYPTLLYAQGGPQSALSQFYSFRWNFQLMAANGYIIVAPNRRGMPGHGVEWNEQISKDWGGQVMQDYLSAIDEVSKESYVDKNRLGAIGASYGGYSMYYLAGIHENRFKTFIAHAGIFNMKSMYGTTEEIFFTNWDNGGPYWETSNTAAQKAYNEFDPINKVDKWNTPMLVIQGGHDYRVPENQSFEAFTAMQLRGIKSRLVYFPEENHWILKAQNALVWHAEFFKWLKETL